MDGIQLAPNGRYLLAAGPYNSRLWDLSSGRPVTLGAAGKCIDFTPDGQRTLVGSGKELNLVETATGGIVYTGSAVRRSL